MITFTPNNPEPARPGQNAKRIFLSVTPLLVFFTDIVWLHWVGYLTYAVAYLYASTYTLRGPEMKPTGRKSHDLYRRVQWTNALLQLLVIFQVGAIFLFDIGWYILISITTILLLSIYTGVLGERYVKRSEQEREDDENDARIDDYLKNKQT